MKKTRQVVAHKLRAVTLEICLMFQTLKKLIFKFYFGRLYLIEKQAERNQTKVARVCGIRASTRLRNFRSEQLYFALCCIKQKTVQKD